MILRKKRVLIIDDDPSMLGFFKQIFSSDYFECLLAPTAFEGLQTAKEKNPDVIFLDMMLPDMSGLGVIRELKSDSDLQNIPVIILSALMDKDVRWAAHDLGAVDYLCKGETSEHIISVAEKYAAA